MIFIPVRTDSPVHRVPWVNHAIIAANVLIYLATDLRETQQRLEDDELIEVVKVPIDRALQMISDGEIEDAKTIIGLMLAAPRLGASMFEPFYPAV